MRRLITALLFVGLLSLLSSCHDDGENTQPVPVGQWTITATGGSCVDDEGQVMLTRLASYERLTVDIGGYDAENDGAVTVALSTPDTDEWLSVRSDTLGTDGHVVLCSQTNDTGARREATLVFTSVTDPSRSGRLTVTQLSSSDDDSNGEDARSVLFVGYGYDIYAELNNPMSVKTKRPIIDIERLQQYADVARLDAIHDCRLQQLNIDIYAASTLQELSNQMTESSSNSKDIDIQGCMATCQKLVDAAVNIDVTEQNVGYGVMTKTVASRTLDKGVLQYLRRMDDDDPNRVNNLCLSMEFTWALQEIRSKSGTERAKAVEQVLLEYGTHIVLQADLGGKIDYAFTMNKSASYHVKTDATEEVKYTLGQITSGDRTTELDAVSSSKSSSGAINIWGGSEESRQLLINDIKNLDQKGQLPPKHMQQWMASVNYSGMMKTDRTLDVVRFELMPVWDLVPRDLRLDFLNGTLKLASRSDCKLPAHVLGTDIYEVNTKQKKPVNFSQLFNFDAAIKPRSGSLCRLLYYEEKPVLEVCSEYVPKIRTDQRVTIVYPIRSCKIRMNQGLFLGDGIHQPAYVGFSNGNCYVNPIDTLPTNYIIEKFWYVNGNLLLKNPSTLEVLKGKSPVVMEDFLPLYTDDAEGSFKHYHPIVKVGSKFWTRSDIDHRMFFAESESHGPVDQMQDGVCYTAFTLEANTKEFNDYNGWIWGYDPNVNFTGKPNMKWYVPKPDDVRDLYEFLGFNAKALFKDQLSGWNAQFNGYYGHIDILNNNKRYPGGKRALRYKGELNVMSSKNTNSDKKACLLVLKPDYTLTLVDDNTYSSQWRTNFYPVRPVRGYQFQYPTIKDINKFEKLAGTTK